MNHESRIKFAFFGSSEFSVYVLDELEKAGYVPALVVTNPDRPKGRGLELAPTPVKRWALERKIAILTLEKLDVLVTDKLKTGNWQLFIVASYGKIIPNDVLKIPKQGTLNVHPSLLPKYRGASPLQAQILADDRDAGVSIMLVDEKMDHGPIVAQEKAEVPNWPVSSEELEALLGRRGGELLARTIEPWITGKIGAKTQDDSKATYTKKITKENGLLDLSGDPYQNYLKIKAMSGWPGTYFFTEKNSKKIRVIVKDAEFKDGSLVITRVIPEGKREMDYEEFVKKFIS